MIRKINNKILKINRSALLGINRIIFFFIISLAISISIRTISNDIFDKFLLDKRIKIVFLGSDINFTYLEFIIKSKYNDKFRIYKINHTNRESEKFHILITENEQDILYFKNASKIVNIAPIINNINPILIKKLDIQYYYDFKIEKNNLFVAFSKSNKFLTDTVKLFNSTFINN